MYIDGAGGFGLGAVCAGAYVNVRVCAAVVFYFFVGRGGVGAAHNAQRIVGVPGSRVLGPNSKILKRKQQLEQGCSEEKAGSGVGGG